MRKIVLTTMFAALLLAACGGIGATPTATPVPPTATPVPVADPQEAILAGLQKAGEVTTYRIELSMSASGDLGDMGLGEQLQGPMELIGVSGAIDGDNTQITMKGLFAAFLGGTPEQGIEMINADGKSYIRGPVPLLNAPENKWYELPADQGSPADTFSSNEIIDSIGNEEVDFSAMTVAGRETLDGVECTIFSADREATLALMESLGETGLPGGGEMEDVERAELRFWICDDGYFHKMTLDFVGVPEGESQTAEIALVFRLYDFDGDIRITAPADAEPIATP